jgi:hypothetical protein
MGPRPSVRVMAITAMDCGARILRHDDARPDRHFKSPFYSLRHVG